MVDKDAVFERRLGKYVLCDPSIKTVTGLDVIKH